MAWYFDAPLNTYRNHALSNNIRAEAIADVQFMKFLRAEPGFGKGRGQSVTITRYLQLPLAQPVSETGGIPSGRPAIETKQVSVQQWAYQVPLTEFEQDLAHFNMNTMVQQVLRNQISLTMDVMCADALKLTPLKYTPLSTGGEFVTDGTADSLADRNLGIQDLRRIHDRLSGTLKCPKYRNGKYVAVLSTRAARGIKNDPEWKDWMAPTSSDFIKSGMLAQNVEGFDIYESNHTAAMADLIGSSTVCGEAIFFGADAGGLLTIMNPELRSDPATNLGTQRNVGWVGTISAFHVWERPSLARVVHLAST